MLCPIRVNTYIFMCKIQEPLYIGGHTNPKGGKRTQYAFEHEYKHNGTNIIIILFAMLYVQNP
jgi:hypothetical protein